VPTPGDASFSPNDIAVFRRERSHSSGKVAVTSDQGALRKQIPSRGEGEMRGKRGGNNVQTRGGDYGSSSAGEILERGRR